jgi:hypothetical protein
MLSEDTGGQWFGGYRKWFPRRSAERPPAAEVIIKRAKKKIDNHKLYESEGTIELLELIFESAGAPVEFNTLLEIVAKIQGIRDWRGQDEVSVEGLAAKNMETGGDGPLSMIENRELLEQVWTEILRMPLRHRRALLLNLRNRRGEEMIRLFPLLRIASIKSIAAALDFPPEDFAGIWNDLPWNDVKIAEFMDLSRQQVINLRQSARAQLLRQMENM